CAFALCGMTPLVSFLFALPYADYLALGLSCLTFFAIGSFKSLWSVKSWWREGLETFLIGITAAALAYGIGHGLNTTINAPLN
ncbi:MAG: VIT1/CCC1 transporter family protein, partial [Fimbriimonadaceae bacterium]|nr:VIT1/CCC1 transporter family protein [Fimbriimonadaceae bacterium]